LGELSLIKLSDYIANFLRENVSNHVFAITGGASLHLMHSVAECEGMNLICTQHEQGASMAADGYARETNKMGVTIATSGPGATNLLTGVCCSFYDSVPTLHLTGQVASFRQRGNLGIRQLGFQETETIDIFKSVTKYANILKTPKDIRYELEKCIYIANHGRPGPVLLDIPDDYQRTMIDPKELHPFIPTPDSGDKAFACTDQTILQVIDLLENSERPILVLGWGVYLSRDYSNILELVNLLGIPTLVSWGFNHLIPDSHPLKIGTFGTHGTRYGNFAVQNCDLILSIGCRLDTHGAGSPLNDFARSAEKIVVDIDEAELNKFAFLGLPDTTLIQEDAKVFIKSLISASEKMIKKARPLWHSYIRGCKEKFPICSIENYEEKEINPYVFVKKLSKSLIPQTTIICDTGCAVAWMMQAFEFKEDQKFFHAYNNTPMGYALPAAIGAYLADPSRKIICIAGDGAFQMNIQELATIVRHNMSIKIFVLDNKGQSMVRQTQDQWFDSKYIGTSYEGGLPLVNFAKVLSAYGIKTMEVSLNEELEDNIKRIIDSPGPIACIVHIGSDKRVVPQSKYGRPLEDAEPLLQRDLFKEYMLVEPLEVSK